MKPLEELRNTPENGTICRNCKYCKRTRGDYATRYEYFCGHENQKHITDYFKENGIKSMPGFLGFSKSRKETELNRKTSPHWCPLMAGDSKTGGD